jgi:hypothetical protein
MGPRRVTLLTGRLCNVASGRSSTSICYCGGDGGGGIKECRVSRCVKD